MPRLQLETAISQMIFKQQSTLAYYCKYLQCTVSKTRKYLATVQCLLSFSRDSLQRTSYPDSVSYTCSLF